MQANQILTLGALTAVFIAAAASPCLSAAPEPTHPASLEDKCANANRGFTLQAQITACASMTAAADLTPEQRANSYVRLGRVYLDGMTYNHALAAFDAATRLAPNNAAAFAGRGEVRLAQEEYYQAISEFDHALKLAPTLNLFAKRGEALSKVGQSEDAIADFTSALAQQPANAKILILRGIEQFKSGNVESAAADVNRALLLDPTLASNPNYVPFMTEFVKVNRP